MPRGAANDNEPPVMTWGKAAPVLGVGIIFDFVRFIFVWFWIIGPALTGTAAGAFLSQYLWDWLAGRLGDLVAGLAGFFGVALFVFVGEVMVIAVGFAGWFLVFGILLPLFNIRIFKANRMVVLWMLCTLFVEEMPLIGTLPILTLTTWRWYRTQIKVEKAAHQAWQAAQAQRLQEQRTALEGELVQRRLALAGAPAPANDNDNEAVEEAANDNGIPQQTASAA